MKNTHKYKIHTYIYISLTFILATISCYDTTKDIMWSLFAGFTASLFWAAIVVDYLKNITDVFINKFLNVGFNLANKDPYITSLRLICVMSSISFACVTSVIFTTLIYETVQSFFKLIHII